MVIWTKEDPVCSQPKCPKKYKTIFPTRYITNKKTHERIFQIIPFSPTEFSYGDITGLFLFKSSRGKQNLHILYDYDSNAI